MKVSFLTAEKIRAAVESPDGFINYALDVYKLGFVRGVTTGLMLALLIVGLVLTMSGS